MYKIGTRKNQVRVSSAKAFPSPTGGLNDLDPLSNMEESFMVDCQNTYPDTDMIKCRPGYRVGADGLAAPVKSFLSYVNVAGDTEVFVVTDDGIYRYVDGSPPVLVYTSITNGYMEFINYTTPAGNYLIAWNGSDPMVQYNGTTWHTYVEADPATDPWALKGLDPSKIIWAVVHMSRIWFIEKDSFNAYYLPVDQVGGDVTPFFMGGNFEKGGYLLSAYRWSSDTGRGMDDRLVFITSEGELSSYSGTDPANADTWSLNASFYLAPPLGQRAITAYGGDILMLCRRGLVPISTLAYGTTSEVMYAGTMSRRINRTIQRMTKEWEALPYKIELFVHVDLLWITINIWDTQTGSNLQLVMNILTGAWGKFSYPVRTIFTVDSITYMGTEDGRVLIITPDNYQDEVTDDDATALPIEWGGIGAFTYLDNPTANKHAKLMRFVVKCPIQPVMNARALPDFRVQQYYPAIIQGPVAGVAARWDEAIWDESFWPTDDNMHLIWKSANVLGYAFAWQFKASARTEMGLAGVEWVWEAGGLV